MSTAVANRVMTDSQKTIRAEDIEVINRKTLRRAIGAKYGSLTTAANRLKIPYARLNGALSGRENISYVLRTIQSDLHLSNEQVKALWPLLGTWPRGENGLTGFEVKDLGTLREALMMKYGKLSTAADRLGAGYAQLSDVLGGRRHTVRVVCALQSDLGLTDDQVLSLWPLLRSWPREIN